MTWFQPIVDTFEHRILAYECLLRCRRGSASEHAAVQGWKRRSFRALAIHSAARQARQGTYFFNLVPASIDDPELDMRSSIRAIFDSGMKPRNVVFSVNESDLTRDPVHSRFIREYLRSNGFGFALSSAGRRSIFRPSGISSRITSTWTSARQSRVPRRSASWSEWLKGPARAS